MLNVVDVGSRFAWSRPMKSKTAAETSRAFRSIFRSIPAREEYNLITDSGKEFLGSEMKNFYNEFNINHIQTKSIHKAMIAERFNRTLKDITQKYLDANQTNRFVDVLPSLVSNYNNRFHSYHQMTPEEATKV